MGAYIFLPNQLFIFKFSRKKRFSFFIRSQVIEYIFIFLLKPYFQFLSFSIYNLSEYVRCFTLKLYFILVGLISFLLSLIYFLFIFEINYLN